MKNSIGVIDIGSNSVHLVVGQYHDRGNFSIIDDVKVNVRLCEGFNETGLLSPYRMDLGEETLAMFKRMCDAYGVEDIVAVATAAVRKAKNGEVWTARIKASVGIDIEIIPGEREAAMDYLGTINSIDIEDGLLMDIGGGSVEFVLIRGRQKVEAISLPFGSIDLAEMFHLEDTITEGNLLRLEAYLLGAFSQYPIFKNAQGLPVLGVGGTIRNLGRIHRRQVDYPLEIAHNYQMSPQEVGDICRLSAAMTMEERLNLKGLSKGRADIFVGASQAVRLVMEAIASPLLIISDCGLRDGVMYEFFGNGEDNLVGEVFETSLANAMMNLEVNVPHAQHIYGLSTTLFKALSPLHGIQADVRKIQKTSAMLHDAGISIQYSNHHEHSFYLILNAGIYGLTHKEQLMAAFCALNHRTNKKVKVDALYESLLDKADRAIINNVSLCLQISEYLDRSMDGIVTQVSCAIDAEAVTLNVTSKEHTVFADMIISECGKKFRRVLGRELRVVNQVVD